MVAFAHYGGCGGQDRSGPDARPPAPAPTAQTIAAPPDPAPRGPLYRPTGSPALRHSVATTGAAWAVNDPGRMADAHVSRAARPH